jgi:hypothetical protein
MQSICTNSSSGIWSGSIPLDVDVGRRLPLIVDDAHVRNRLLAIAARPVVDRVLDMPVDAAAQARLLPPPVFITR